MKQNANLVIMGLFVIGLWYSIGYIQGLEQNASQSFDAGKRVGEQDALAKTVDE